jgi:hypothetical protein
MHNRITSKKLMTSAARLSSLLLLLLYVVGTSHLDLLYSFVHNHDVIVTHSDEQEKDPCHKLLYHNDVKQGCDHKAHLIVSDKCQMCDLIHHGEKSLLTLATFSFGDFSEGHFIFYKSSLDSYLAVISSSRAPPTLA